ncbi:MAG: helix-turn-helix domain-containing protein [Acidiferrobacterales bacterium]|nr:helix-turn-helix domain-containing protein [Acidiferrobacterales bacterium]
MAKIELIPVRSGCPIASTLDLVGDKWTLIIVRDMVTGKKRFGEFMDSPEGIKTNILTSRLRKMEEAGLVERKAYQRNPARFEYLLTERGHALLPVLQEMCRWANAHIGDTWTPPGWFMEAVD